MPPIMVCGRRWGVGSDDFVFPALGELVLRTVWLISLLLVLALHNDLLLECKDGAYLQTYYIVMIVILSIAIVLSVLLAYASSQGRIIEKDSSSRKCVAPLVKGRVAFSVLDVVWTVYGTRWAFVETVCDSVVVIVLRCAVVVGWLLVLALIVGIVVVFDPLGHHRSGSDVRVESERLWKLRCRVICCCFTANDEHTTNAYEDAAQLLADYFKDVDLVPTDVVAALILIQQHQHMRVDVEGHRFTGVAAGPSTGMIDKPTWMTVPLAAHYMTFASACYGWPYYVFDNLCCGPCRLLTGFSCCDCLRDSSTRVLNDNCCMCHTSAILKRTGISRSDILFATFSNKVFETPFFIAEDKKHRSIVVAVRGTMSLSDALTDMSATPEIVPGIDAVPNPMAHRGILKAAQNVRDVIVNNRLLEEAFERYPTHRLVVTGHSLGAGTAAILAVLLRSIYPQLICFAYAPPGWLVSLPLSQYMKEFVCSTVVGNDLVARLGITTMERLKEDMIEALDQCRHPKYRVLLGGAWNSVCCLPPVDIGDSETDIEQPRRHLLDRNASRVQRYNEERGGGVSISTENSSIENDYSQVSLYMPGHVMYLEEVEPSKSLCSTPNRSVTWAAPEAFDEVIVGSRMVADHMPDAVLKALNAVAEKIMMEQSMSQVDLII